MKNFAQSVLLVAIAVLLVAVLVVHAGPAQAGDCTRTEKEYVAALRQLSKNPSPEIIPIAVDAMHCLRCGVPEGDPWGNLAAATTFDKCAKAAIRDSLAAACLPLMADTTALPGFHVIPRYSLAFLLATYGISKVGTNDIYRIITQEIPKRRPLATGDFMALATLRDPRTLRFLANEYAIDVKYPSPRRELRIRDVADCLYHMRGDSALVLAQMILDRETDPNIQNRCRQVLNR
jgi:hypothetical protein